MFCTMQVCWGQETEETDGEISRRGTMSSKEHEIPDIIVARLPKYLRALSVLQSKGETTNSKELGALLG